MKRGLENRISLLEAEVAENERFEAEGPRLGFAEALEQACKRWQENIDGHPEPTLEEIAADRGEMVKRLRRKRER